jgi:hypothetical protein
MKPWTNIRKEKKRNFGCGHNKALMSWDYMTLIDDDFNLDATEASRLKKRD